MARSREHCRHERKLKDAMTVRANDTTDLATFAIIIPAWNESEFIEKSIHSANAAIKQCRYTGRVIVVDNNSTDDTASKAAHAGAEVVFEPINQIARARNTGARAANTDWLVFLDADTTLNPTLLNESLSVLDSGKVIGGGSVIELDREVRGAAKLSLTAWNWWSRFLSLAAGCYIYCDRNAFETVGGFDETRYVAEELFLSAKLKKLAKTRGQRFVVQTLAPVVSSARKLDWYSKKQMIWQVLLLMIPSSTKSKKSCAVWYGRDNIKKP